MRKRLREVGPTLKSTEIDVSETGAEGGELGAEAVLNGDSDIDVSAAVTPEAKRARECTTNNPPGRARTTWSRPPT